MEEYNKQQKNLISRFQNSLKTVHYYSPKISKT